MKRYCPELDGVRAVAVTLVVLFHAAPFGPFSGGFIGVDIFFVLSAFLITGILDQGQRLSTFYWRRFLRLMPALLLMLAVYVAAAPLVWPQYPHGRDAAFAAFYLSDYGYSLWHIPLYLQHSWSLAVEEHFYLLWPFLLPALKRARRPDLWLAGAFVLLTLWRLPFVGDWHDYYYRFDTHATGLVAGAWLYFARPRVRAPMAGIAAAVLALIAVCANIRLAWLFITPAELAAVAVIGFLVRSPSAVLAWPPLVALGRISYGVYLWHFPIAYALRGTAGFELSALITFTASVATATLSYWSVEAWARQQRDRRPGGELAATG